MYCHSIQAMAKCQKCKIIFKKLAWVFFLQGVILWLQMVLHSESVHHGMIKDCSWRYFGARVPKEHFKSHYLIWCWHFWTYSVSIVERSSPSYPLLLHRHAKCVVVNDWKRTLCMIKSMGQIRSIHGEAVHSREDIWSVGICWISPVLKLHAYKTKIGLSLSHINIEYWFEYSKTW